MTLRDSLVALTAATGLAGLAYPAVLFAQDTTQVNPTTAHLKFENDQVRVLEVELRPGDKEQMHSHPAYITYVLTGGTVRNHLSNGKVIDVVFKEGDVIWREAVTHWGENIGTTPARVIILELKSKK